MWPFIKIIWKLGGKVEQINANCIIRVDLQMLLLKVALVGFWCVGPTSEWFGLYEVLTVWSRVEPVVSLSRVSLSRRWVSEQPELYESAPEWTPGRGWDPPTQQTHEKQSPRAYTGSPFKFNRIWNSTLFFAPSTPLTLYPLTWGTAVHLFSSPNRNYTEKTTNISAPPITPNPHKIHFFRMYHSIPRTFSHILRKFY